MDHVITRLLLATLLAASPLSGATGGDGAPSSSPSVAVPEGGHVLTDGVFDDGEWDDAAALRLGGVELLAKRDERYLYLALRFVDGKHSGLDLYLAAAPEVRRLFHVSSELGTKRFEEGSWTDFDWNVRGWVGNPVGYNHDPEHLVIHEPDGFELQLSRAMLAAEGLGGPTLRLAFRLKRPEVEVPEGAEAAKLGEWIVLELAGGSGGSASTGSAAASPAAPSRHLLVIWRPEAHGGPSLGGGAAYLTPNWTNRLDRS